MLVVYRMTKMTGRLCSDLVEEALSFKTLAQELGLKVLDPVLIEKVPNKHVYLREVAPKKLARLWQRDKQCLRDAHVAINCNALSKTIGGEREYGLMRFCYWKPVILVYPDNQIPYISRYEDDYTAASVKEALLFAKTAWDTYPKRLMWRLKMLATSLPKFIIRQLRFLLQ